MAQIYNSDLTKELTEGAKIQVSRDYPPSQLADKVVPVMEVNPKLLRRTGVLVVANRIISGSLTIFTCPTNVDTIVSGVYLGFTKDATCDIATGRITITATPDDTGAATSLAALPCLTTTAERGDITIDFHAPIKLKPGSVIAFGSDTYTAGLMSREILVYGYYVSNQKS